MKSFAGKVFKFAYLLLALVWMLSGKWERLQEAYPTASREFLTTKMAIFSGQIALSLIVFFLLLGLLTRFSPRLKKLGEPSRGDPPPTDAGPLYAIRTFPLHVAVCVGSVGACLLTAPQWPHVAMGLVAFSIAAWVALGRRMGFEPVDAQNLSQKGS